MSKDLRTVPQVLADRETERFEENTRALAEAKKELADYKAFNDIVGI